MGQTVLNAVLVILALIGGIATLIQLGIWFRQWSGSRVHRITDFERHAMRLRENIKKSGFQPTFVLGIGRGGAFVAGWLAGNLGSLPIEVIDRAHSRKAGLAPTFDHGERKIALLREVHGDNAKVLVVEGADVTSRTFTKFREVVATAAPGWDCKYGALYTMAHNRAGLDFVAKRLRFVPKAFPWKRAPENFQSHEAEKGD